MTDPYIYPGTTILINKLDIMKSELLRKAEAEYTGWRIKQLSITPIKGNYDFEHLCKIQRHIFQDLYDWAGEPRIVNISKKEKVLDGMSIEYSPVQYIERAVSYALSDMKTDDWSNMQLPDKIESLAKYMSRIWKIHPFREGNTRTVVVFCNQFAQSKGIFLDAKHLANNSTYLRDCLVNASAIFSDTGDISKPSFLVEFLKEAAELGVKERTQRFLKKPLQKKDYDNYIDR